VHKAFSYYKKKRKSSTSHFPEQKKKTRMSFDEQELLILEVQKREALWNFQLDVKQRNVKERKNYVRKFPTH